MKKMNKILFVCLGNICRSPCAEGIMKTYLKERKLQNQISCESAGTSGAHAGEAPDARMRRHAQKRGFPLTGQARQFVKEDFIHFDYILAMDDSNVENIWRLDPHQEFKNKVFKMTDFARQFNFDEVPDPYFGGDQGFETVIDILEDACQGLLEYILKHQQDKNKML